MGEDRDFPRTRQLMRAAVQLNEPRTSSDEEAPTLNPPAVVVRTYVLCEH